MVNFIRRAFNAMYLKLFGSSFLKRPSKREMDRYFQYREGVLVFKSVIEQNITPTNDQIGEKDFMQVVYKNRPMWALFRCPCGCREVISLSLQNVHNPHWTLTVRKNRPSLYPSVWQKVGCRSHFWIHDGYVYWV